MDTPVTLAAPAPTGHEVRAQLSRLVADLAASVNPTDPDLDTVDALSRLTEALTRYSAQGLAMARFSAARRQETGA